jgi:mannose-6-phosphate isomerase-like protein (cupin superfamily)
VVQPDADHRQRLGRAAGGDRSDFHWHHHEDTDEFFLVLEGELQIDFEDQPTVALKPHQGYTIPKGIVHRTRAPERTSILMVEAAGVVPTGDGVRAVGPTA